MPWPTSHITSCYVPGTVPPTTVGYGDLYPATPPGKLVGDVLTFTGIIVMALPMGIIATGLEDELRDARKVERRKAVEKAIRQPYKA